MNEHDWDTAREDAHALGTRMRLTPETVSLHHAGGRVLAQDLLARYPIPHCATSAMDGYAVSGTGPWTVLNAHANNPAEEAGVGLHPGEAVAVVTGSQIPAGTSVILRSENTSVSGQFLSTHHVPTTGTDIRPAGTEAQAGDILQEHGTALRAGVIATAAVAGYDELLVTALPKIHCIYTGNEVVTEGTPQPGQVRDGFSPVLPLIIESLGAVSWGSTRIGDSLEETVAAFSSTQAQSADIIVTTGGTGFSARDFIRPAAQALGGQEVISSIAMRPGHPSMMSVLDDQRILIALPGNPLAALMAVMTLLDPLLRGANGTKLAPLRSALSAETLRALPGRYRLIPARWVPSNTPDEVDRVIPAEHVGSAMLRGLSGAQLILVIPPAGVVAGKPVPYLELPW